MIQAGSGALETPEPGWWKRLKIALTKVGWIDRFCGFFRQNARLYTGSDI